MKKDDPSIVPPVEAIRAVAYPPDLSKPTKYVYLDLEWTTDGEFEIIEVGCVPRRHYFCCGSEEGGGGNGKENQWEPAGQVFSSLIRTRRPKTDKQLGSKVHHITGTFSIIVQIIYTLIHLLTRHHTTTPLNWLRGRADSGYVREGRKTM